MTDLATLGLAIDSRAADEASAALDRLAKKAQAAEDFCTRMAQKTGKSVDEMRAKYGGAGAEINKALEAAKAGGQGMASVAAQVQATMQKASGSTTATIIDFKRAVGDATQTALAGGSAFQSLSAGASSAAGSLVATRAGMVAVTGAGVAAGLVLGGLTATAIAAALAYARFNSEQRKLSDSLVGRGRGAGLTPEALLRASDAGASAAGIARSNAIGATAQFASSGLSGNMIPSALAAAQHFVNVAGGELESESAKLARALAEPDKAGLSLLRSLGQLDDATAQNIKSMSASGDALGAQTLLMLRYQSTVDGLTDRRPSIERYWQAMKDGANEAAESVGRSVARLVDPTLEQRYAAALKRAQPSGGIFSIINRSAAADEAADLNEQIRRRNAQASQQGRQVSADNLSLSAGDLIRATDPTQARSTALVGQIKTIEEALSNPLVKLGMSSEAAQKALEKLRTEFDNLETPLQKMTRDNALAVQSIQARTLGEKLAVSSEQARVSAMRQFSDASIAATAAEGARAKAIAEATRAAEDAVRSANDNLQLAGKSPYEQAIIRAQQQNRDLRDQTAIPAGSFSATSAASLAPATSSAMRGLDAAFASSLQQLLKEFPSVSMTSGYRSYEQQAALYDNRASNPYPVAKPGTSNHGRGTAADLSIPSGMRADVVARATQLGMVFPYANDPVHIEPAGGRSIQSSAASASGGIDPRLAQSIRGSLAQNSTVDAINRGYYQGSIGSGSRDLEAQNVLLEAQAKAFGATTEAAAKYNYEAQQQAMLIRAGVPITDAYKESLSGLGDKYGELAKRTEEFSKQQELAKGMAGAFTDFGRAVVLSGQGAGQALQQLSKKLQEVILNALLFGPLEKQLTGLLGGSGGLLGSLGSIFGGGGGAGAPMSILPTSGFSFANGGIMSAGGSIPLNRYAGGGIADSPQLALFGEGRMKEAYVPLPDGRTIPVSMRNVTPANNNSSGGGSPVSVVVNNNSSNTQATASQDAQGNTTISIDDISDALEARMAGRINKGQGSLAPLLRSGRGRIGRG